MQNRTAALIMIAAFLGVSTIGSMSAAEARYTGCLKQNGKLVRVVSGDSPKAPCKKNQTEITFSDTDDTVPLTELKATDEELKATDEELMTAVASLKQQVRALEEEIDLSMQCFGTRYLDLGLTVVDCQTRLEWEKKTVDNVKEPIYLLGDRTQCFDQQQGGNVDCQSAAEFIAHLNTEPCFAGHCDWRLPSIDKPGGSGPELETILDCSFGEPCIDPIFGPTDAAFYWSSVAGTGNDADGAWNVNFISGGVFLTAKENDFGKRVRAVRTVP